VHAFKRCETVSDAQVFFVASLPGVGREKATAILDSYQTPINALINVDDWPRAVDGLGPVITNKVKEVLSTPHREAVNKQRNKLFLAVVFCCKY